MIARVSPSDEGHRRLRGARHGIGAIVCAIAVVGSAPAYAQPAKPTPTTQDIATVEARARFDEGIKQAELGDHESARLKFNQAWALLKSPAILYNLARAEQLSGHAVEALEHYRQFAKMSADPKVTDVQRQRTAENITELSKKVGQLEIEAPPGARVSVDGRTIDPGNTEPIPVTPGKHVVEASANGKVTSVSVDATAGTVTKAKLTESNIATPPPAIATSAAPPPADARDKATPIAPSPQGKGPSFWTTGRIVGAGLVGGGLLSLGAGVIVGISAADEEEKATTARESLPEPRASACNDQANKVACARLQDAVDNQTARENVRTGLFIAGGAFVVGGAVLVLLSSPKSDSTRGSARVIPIATAREAGFAVVGRF